MSGPRIAVVGVGATGAVVAAALLKVSPETTLVTRRPDLRRALVDDGLNVSGALTYQVPVQSAVASVPELSRVDPDVVFICTKTTALHGVLDELEGVFRSGMKIVSAHNGLGTEDVVAERFGREAAFRMNLNFGAAISGPGTVETAFFNPPNHLGCLSKESREIGELVAALLTRGGLDTQLVDDIGLFVWKKMMMKCTMASICAVTDKTIKGALEFPPTREIADACFQEFLDVAAAMGYDLGQDHLTQAVAYLAKVGVHKDSMCHDIAARRRTEIDFLGGKVVEYARQKGIPTPHYVTMTNLVRALEDNYLER